MEFQNILKSLARVFGLNNISTDEAQQKLDNMLSFEELKAQAKEEVEEEFYKKINAQNEKIKALESDVETLTKDKEALNLRVVELEKTPAAEHTTGSVEIVASVAAEYDTPINRKAAAIRAKMEQQK